MLIEEKKMLILIINVIKKRNLVHLMNKSKGFNPFFFKIPKFPH
jgi:hypothetical protein